MIPKRKIIKKEGGDVVSGLKSIANKIGIKLKNWHLPNHNYTGPFTELDVRLDENGNPKPGYEPYNQIDKIAMHHDHNYRLADKGIMTRSDADKIMLHELDKVKTKGFREKVDYAIVKPIIWLKYKLGLGIPSIDLATELHKPIRTKFKRRRVFVFNIDDIWSSDLMDKQNLSKHNKGYKYILTIIDVFSKFAYAIPLKSKSSKEIMEAFTKLFFSRKPKKLWTDQGSEFTNNIFTKFLKDNNIDLYHVYNEGKACVVERFNRTLGEMIAKHMTTNNTKNYINILQKLLDEYNNKNHSSIKMSPFEASKLENRDEVYNNLYKEDEQSETKPKFKVGDRVRITRKKNRFEKGSTENWTREIFVITKIRNTKPVVYHIEDLNGEGILGSFYESELQKTKF